MKEDVKFRFYNLAWNPEIKRGDEIIEEMNKRRASDPNQTNGEWLEWCLNNLAEDEAERYFIVFTVGTAEGWNLAIAHEKKKKN